MKPIHFIGSAGAILIVLVSIFMNAAFGYSQGYSDLQHVIFAAVCIAADLIKIYLPWPIAAIWRSPQFALTGKFIILVSTVCLWGALTTWSVVSSFGFTEQSKSTASNAADHKSYVRERLRAELLRLTRQRDGMDAQPHPAELKARASDRGVFGGPGPELESGMFMDLR